MEPQCLHLPLTCLCLERRAMSDLWEVSVSLSRDRRSLHWSLFSHTCSSHTETFPGIAAAHGHREKTRLRTVTCSASLIFSCSHSLAGCAGFSHTAVPVSSLWKTGCPLVSLAAPCLSFPTQPTQACSPLGAPSSGCAASPSSSLSPFLSCSRSMFSHPVNPAPTQLSVLQAVPCGGPDVYVGLMSAARRLHRDVDPAITPSVWPHPEHWFSRKCDCTGAQGRHCWEPELHILTSVNKHERNIFYPPTLTDMPLSHQTWKMHVTLFVWLRLMKLQRSLNIIITMQVWIYSAEELEPHLLKNRKMVQAWGQSNECPACSQWMTR